MQLKTRWKSNPVEIDTIDGGLARYRWLGLDMSHNHLTALPDHLFNFTCRLRLASLNLSHNNLHTLSPGVLTPVSNLRRLDLTFNR